MQFSATLQSLEDLPKVASDFAKVMPQGAVFALYGEMGAGKTTFIKAVCHALGVLDVVTSPTFSLVNEYETEQGETLYHFDFYRLREPEEAYDFGYEDYLSSGNTCFFEWPEKIAPLLPYDCIAIHIKETENGKREIKVAPMAQ